MILAVPHYIVLAFLWLAFVVTTIIAGCAIVVTGRYPRFLFDFNVGVLRWNWRVGFYVYAALGTDRYPPFTLAPPTTRPNSTSPIPNTYPAVWSGQVAPGRPAPDHRGPHHRRHPPLPVDHQQRRKPAASQSAILHPQPASRPCRLLLVDHPEVPPSLFDLLVGISRWLYRVLSYVALLHDEYPPFRLDQGRTNPPARRWLNRPIRPSPRWRQRGDGPKQFLDGEPASRNSRTVRRQRWTRVRRKALRGRRWSLSRGTHPRCGPRNERSCPMIPAATSRSPRSNRLRRQLPHHGRADASSRDRQTGRAGTRPPSSPWGVVSSRSTRWHT